MRVLLLEDHPETLRAFAALIRIAGHTCTPCATLAAAFASLASEAFDVVVTDGDLPDGHGGELMDRARSHHRLRGMLVTAHLDPSGGSGYSAAGFDLILIKPVGGEDLMRAVGMVAAMPALE